eukprot:COSAG06_NODE_1719_length_8590_cov_18.960311_1_plen_35_part_10
MMSEGIHFDFLAVREKTYESETAKDCVRKFQELNV